MRGILQWTVQFHQRLAKCLKHCAQCHSERTQMAMQYLIVHEEHLAALVKASSDRAQTSELEILFIEYLDKSPIILHDHSDFESKTESEIVSSVIEQHQQVIQLYKYLKGQAVIPHHEEFLDRLLKLENQEVVLMAQGLNRFQDM